MKMAMIGLGKMGANMVRRLARDGHEILGHDVDFQVAEQLAAEYASVTAAASLQDCVSLQEGPRVIWLMIPHSLVDQSLDKLLASGLSAGDIVIDGGNSNFNLSRGRGLRLAEQGIEFVDCGTSGGVWGLDNGYSLMVGGSDRPSR